MAPCLAPNSGARQRERLCADHGDPMTGLEKFGVQSRPSAVGPNCDLRNDGTRPRSGLSTSGKAAVSTLSFGGAGEQAKGRWPASPQTLVGRCASGSQRNRESGRAVKWPPRAARSVSRFGLETAFARRPTARTVGTHSVGLLQLGHLQRRDLEQIPLETSAQALQGLHHLRQLIDLLVI